MKRKVIWRAHLNAWEELAPLAGRLWRFYRWQIQYGWRWGWKSDRVHHRPHASVSGEG